MRAEARVAVRLLLQHHPLCHYFAADRLRVGALAVCSGCAAAIPTALVGVALGFALVVRGVPAWPVVTAALVLGLPHLSTYLHRGGRAWRFAAKAMGGLGLGTLVGSAWMLPIARPWLWGGSAAMMAAFAALQALRLRAILRTCDACPYARDWGRCPGFLAQPRDPGPAPTS